MNRIRRAEIRKLAKQIGAQFNPYKIVLFGSYAYGRPTIDSDVDLLVLMDTPLSNVQQAGLIRRAVSFPFATDLLVRTPDQLNRRLEIGDDFMHEIVKKGLVLYEAVDA